MEIPGPIHQSLEAQAKQQTRWAHSPTHQQTGTQPPLITPRDKAPPTRGIRINSIYQWAGTSPSHQEVYSKPLYQLQTQGRQTPEVREATMLLPVKRSSHQKPIKMKRQSYNSDERERKKSPENQLSDQEILSL